MSRISVLVTDAECRQALAIVRSLGSRGISVTACSRSKRSQGSYSRFCSQAMIAPEPSHADYLSTIIRKMDQTGIDVLLPVLDESALAASKNRDELLDHCALVTPDLDTFMLAADKRRTLELASRIGVSVPAEVGREDPYPKVVKPRWGRRVRYVKDVAELDEALRAVPDCILQEYIPGTGGYAVNVLLDKGRPLAVFTHRELREYPPSGGSATLAESIPANEATEMGLRLLEKMAWHGIAMVEFKKDRRDGSYKLMEVNPRFWASLELAIVCGIDFPALTVDLALGNEVRPVDGYRTGVRFRWLAQDILHLAERKRSLTAFAKDFLSTSTRYDVRPDDIKPNIYELATSLLWAAERILGSESKHRIA